ncbi:hypothetical protein BC941DRAFT_369789 [Chlamydoabsidia padenii]|nr:hypothetical protein BC941DRAFT_369789 [Chlamydoabsidia padenii]
MIQLQQDQDQLQQQEEHTTVNMESTPTETETGTANTVPQQEQQARSRTITISSSSSTYPMDEDSDMESSFGDSEEHQMDYWMQRCSICFDAPLDLCLEFCGDQYCNGCFQRYVTEVVMSSWGLSVTTLKCPVCQEHIPQSEWSQFVPQSVVDHYDRFNQPYRSFTRCCPHCEEEAKPCDHTLHKQGIDYMKNIRSVVESLVLEHHHDLIQLYSDDEDSNNEQGGKYIDEDSDGYNDDYDDDYDDYDDYDDEDNTNNEDDDSIHDDDNDITDDQLYTPLISLLILLGKEYLQSTILDVYKETMKTLFTFEQQYQKYSKKRPQFAATILRHCRIVSSTFLLLDVTPETWKQMQFLHISHFPNTTCSKCQTDFCLQCGHNTHESLTCEDNMKQLVEMAPHQDQDTVVTAKWHLNNSQRCPNCSIMINRDEGCNKVDCSLCGFCFCWACLSPWSEKCGFYHCATTEGTNRSSRSTSGTKHQEEGRAELGVPNISSIEARLLTNGSHLG